MALIDEVEQARTEIISDGYEMSVGELINIYKDNEMQIDPAFQRLFRWDESRKTRFIESLLLGIPIPPIFVFQDENGVWELIDGLQRLSTIFQFVGALRGERAEELGPLILSGTKFLPSLDGMRWEPSVEDAEDDIGQTLQLQLKRSRLRVEILKKESDPTAKFELFQRLNTGGAGLSEQEIRNCVAVMINKPFYDWLVQLSQSEDFVATTSQTDKALESQAGMELALRFLTFRNFPYQNGLDVHEYLDEAIIALANNEDLDLDSEKTVFEQTFRYLNQALGDTAFKRWDGNDFRGKFLMSVFEVLSPGVSYNLEEISKMSEDDRNEFIVSKAKVLWDNEVFQTNSGGGVRGTTRLMNLLPLGQDHLKPE